MLRGAVQFLAGDVLVDFGRAFPVRPVGAAKVRGVGHPGRSFLLAVAAEAPGAGSATAGVTAGLAAVEGSGCPVLTVPEWPAVLAAATKPAAVTLTLTARTITKRLAITVAAATKPATVTLTLTARTIPKRLTVTVAAATKPATVTLTITARTIPKRLTVTVAAATKPATVTLTITARTIPKRLPVTITKRLPVTITKRLPVTVTAATKPAAITLTITARTITKRLPVTITAATKPATVTLTITARTIPKRLTVTVAVRLPFTAAGGTAATGEVVAVAVVTGPEAAGLTAGVVVAAERAAVVAAIATVVLGHMESSCCEPTTGATAAARFVSYATRNQALRSPYIFINSSGATKISRTVKALAAGSWPSSQPRPITSCRFPGDAGSVPAAFSGVGGGDI
ncbi:hypothetical protein PUN71_016735 [Arthrobacter sp. NQ7]|uniref:hypothetical protein n=1 Tax=Arthrobacter sp. NQ7 TaxID=3032303 RepID=UPI00240F6B60|nr:hypothetical protein [Arthrobacter sp. NQ7]MDJ0458852.1 hypothetical protein [Arthrobacter sp. NQ7]